MNRRGLLKRAAKLAGGGVIGVALGELAHPVRADYCSYRWVRVVTGTCTAYDREDYCCYGLTQPTCTPVYYGGSYCTCQYPNPCAYP